MAGFSSLRLYARLQASPFIRDERGQDFMEYILLAGAIAAVALLALGPFKAQLMAGFNAMINALGMAISP